MTDNSSVAIQRTVAFLNIKVASIAADKLQPRRIPTSQFSVGGIVLMMMMMRVILTIDPIVLILINCGGLPAFSGLFN